MNEPSERRVLLLGLDGADWKIIRQLLDKGKMPALERLMSQGVSGNIATLKPSLSPLLWSTVATGKPADKHNILGFTEPSPDGSGARPVSSDSWGSLPLWLILSRQGLKSAVVNWFATHPADVMEATVVSDFFRHGRPGVADTWAMPPRAVSPEWLAPVMQDVIVHPADVTASQLASFFPEAYSLRGKKDKKLTEMKRLFAQCVTVHGAGTYLAEHGTWNLLAVYYDTLDRICHHFMPYRAPRMPYVSEKDCMTYGEVVDHWYGFFDGLLAEYLDLVDERTTIVIVSDHGFHSDHLRPLGSQHTGFRNPVHWHRDHGILVCRGAAMKSNASVSGASLLDIAPTVLHLLGLPVAKDMEGRVLAGMYEEPLEPECIDTYETSCRRLFQTTQSSARDPHGVHEALEQLAELGYIEPVPEDGAEAAEKAAFTNQLTLAEVHLEAGRLKESAVILEGLLSANRKQKQVRLRLAECYSRMGKLSTCRKMVDEILAEDAHCAQARIICGDILLSEEAFESALTHYEKAQEKGPNLPRVFNKMADLYLKQKRWSAAEGAFKEALDLDKDNAEAYGGLGMALYHQGECPLAVESLSRSVDLLYDQPLVHFHLGLTLSAMDRNDEAIEAVKRALELQPDMAPAQDLLARLYRMNGEKAPVAGQKVGARDMGEKPREKVKRAKPPATGRDTSVITIVTGLPRSGTSMIMQMLAAGGMALLTDGIRRADEDNPRGYFEFEKAKAIKRDVSWLKEAQGKAVKLVYPLLYHLPSNETYQVIFMERYMDEILASQRMMLARSEKKAKDRKNQDLKRVFETEMARATSWLKRQQNLSLNYVPYRDVVENPMEWAGRINRFLGGNLNRQNMAAVVDKQLYRQRR